MDFKVIIATLVRHGLSALGIYLVGKGYIGADEAQGLVEALCGTVMAIGAAVWSYSRTKKLEAAPPVIK